MNSNEQLANSKPKHDTLGGIITGLLFIIAGAFILADNQGLLFEGWLPWFLFTGGMVLLGDALVRTTMESNKRSVTSRVVWGSIMLILGAGQLYDIEAWWPLGLVLAGSILILHAIKKTSNQSA